MLSCLISHCVKELTQDYWQIKSPGEERVIDGGGGREVCDWERERREKKGGTGKRRGEKVQPVSLNPAAPAEAPDTW